MIAKYGMLYRPPGFATCPKGFVAFGDHPNFSDFGPEANLFPELAALFGDYAARGTGRARKYLHDDAEAAPYGRVSK